MLNLIMQIVSGEDENIVFSLTQLFSLIFVTLFCLSIHESAHAWTAAKLGDHTGRLSGRITVNPMAHLTLIGTICMVLIGFGYAKPVPVNINNFPAKKRKLYFALTSLAGPASNFLVAIVSVVIMNIFLLINNKTGSEPFYIAYLFFLYVAYYNIALAIFNLIPIPPLDGSRLFTMILPDKLYYKLLSVERYLVMGFLLVIYLISRVSSFDLIGTVAGGVLSGINFIVSLLFNLFY